MVAGYLDGRKPQAKIIADVLRMYTDMQVAVGHEIDNLSGDGFADAMADKLGVETKDLIFVDTDNKLELNVPEEIVLEKTE